MNIRTDYAHEINTRAFNTLVPEYYNRSLPKYFEEHNVPPIYEASDLNECEAKSTVAEIIDLVVNNVPFTMVNPEDMRTVVELIEGYIRQVNPYIESNPDLKAFVSRAEITRLNFGDRVRAVDRYNRNTNTDSNHTPTLAEWFSFLNRG